MDYYREHNLQVKFAAWHTAWAGWAGWPGSWAPVVGCRRALPHGLWGPCGHEMKANTNAGSRDSPHLNACTIAAGAAQ